MPRYLSSRQAAARPAPAPYSYAALSQAPLSHTIRLCIAAWLLSQSAIVLAAETDDTMVVVGTALKVDAPLVETPRPVSTVNREELDTRNVQQLDETFRYRAGVLSGHYGSDNNTDWFKVRGFDQSTYQDGLRIYREGFYQWLPETWGLERVDLFKGPSSILYGEAPPGGLINAISKRPSDEPQTELQMQIGNRGLRQMGLDTSGYLSEYGDVRYRLVGLYRERDGDLDHTENERYYFAPSLTWDISDATQLTLLASLQKDDGVPTNAFKLAYGTNDDTPFGKVDPQTNYSEPGYDKDERTQTSLGYELRHQVNDTWALEQDFRYSQLDLDLISSYILYQSSAREGQRGLLYREGTIDSYTVDNRAIGKWYGERTENTLLLGVDYQNLSLSGKEADDYAFGDPIDLFDPQYGNYTALSDEQITRRDIDKEQIGLYVQDQLRIDDKWVLLAGVRYDQAETENVNQTTGSRESSDDDEISWSGGVMYLSDFGLNPYLSYTESFEPISATDDRGSLYEPREGRQWELGAKYQPAGWDGYLTAAVFELTEDNTLVTTGGFQVQEGERQSRGFELEMVGYLTDHLKLTSAYTYTDARLENDVRAPLIPRHQASSWLDYAFERGALEGLRLGAGARYVGESVDGDATVSDYLLFDAMVGYDFTRELSAQVNVSNLTDKEYVASCSYWCYYGESRSIIGSLTYHF
ncbi:MAG: TonB-dependent siderophore receptor [Gammaproteobacteria bacterium]|nr:TonB-dependent siderophore receptor [Gammaproteobacteria bacterium]